VYHLAYLDIILKTGYVSLVFFHVSNANLVPYVLNVKHHIFLMEIYVQVNVVMVSIIVLRYLNALIVQYRDVLFVIRASVWGVCLHHMDLDKMVRLCIVCILVLQVTTRKIRLIYASYVIVTVQHV